MLGRDKEVSAASESERAPCARTGPLPDPRGPWRGHQEPERAGVGKATPRQQHRLSKWSRMFWRLTPFLDGGIGGGTGKEWPRSLPRLSAPQQRLKPR